MYSPSFFGELRVDH